MRCCAGSSLTKRWAPGVANVGPRESHAGLPPGQRIEAREPRANPGGIPLLVSGVPDGASMLGAIEKDSRARSESGPPNAGRRPAGTPFGLRPRHPLQCATGGPVRARDLWVRASTRRAWDSSWTGARADARKVSPLRRLRVTQVTDGEHPNVTRVGAGGAEPAPG